MKYSVDFSTLTKRLENKMTGYIFHKTWGLKNQRKTIIFFFFRMAKGQRNRGKEVKKSL
jgi:hypothetical protein